MNQATSTGSLRSPSGTMHSSDSGSQSKPPSKRASRAGTRSVSTLSSAQLDRKRANDREAQRAIRQRTKDHIESLERRISELTSAHEAREKLFLATQQRNQELEDEVAYLRARLPGDAFTSMNVNQTEDKAPPQYSVSAPESQTQSGLSTSRPSSSAASRSGPQPIEAWRQQSQYSPTSGPPSASFVPEATQNPSRQNAASWRAQEMPSAASYGYQVRQNDRANYAAPVHQMTYPNHSQATQFQLAAQGQTQPPLSPGFHNGGIAHPDFQNMPQYAASSNPGYHEQQQQSHASFVPGAPPVSSAASEFHGAPRILAPPAYNPTTGAAHFMNGQASQIHNQPMAFREGVSQHAYGYDA